MEPFKNVFSPEMVACIAGHLEKHAPAFDRAGFEQQILNSLQSLEFKDRAQLIADTIHQALPAGHDERARILHAILHPNEEGHSGADSNEDGLNGWAIQPLTMLVGQHGVEDFDRSLWLQKEMTKRSTSEFGIRYFLLADQERALKIMENWICDPNVHVRRLVSEGTRPRLPWAMQLPRLIDDPSPMLPVLTALRDDAEEYVRRSVANHLNDIAKDHPDLVADIAKDWLAGADKNRQRLVRHACRTLIKSGHKGTLEAFGLGAPKIAAPELEIRSPRVNYGSSLEFEADIVSNSKTAQSLVVDFLIHFRKANGKLAPKVFKLTKFDLGPGETKSIKRAHPIRPITTRKYYPGVQGLSLRINGMDFGYGEFELIMPEA